ncbi:hypothetical protein QP938_12395 [Porticoccaceae bacterium LTM1]|nr:hypothetical protein QP938_12395 [Porticoccaceae bacterium LTM1]
MQQPKIRNHFIARLAIFSLATLLLSGCQYFPFTVKEAEPTQSTIDNQRIVDLLMSRELLCALPEIQRSELIRQHQNNANRDQLFERLLLATCEPDKTPGVLSNALIQLHASGDLTEAERAFLGLIAAQSRTYNHLFDNYQAVKQELEKTIRGIQQIESDMGQLDKPTENEKHDSEEKDEQ